MDRIYSDENLANEILVNSNMYLKNTVALDEFIKPHIFLNNIIRHKNDLMIGAVEFDIDQRYDYRPDLLAYMHYGQDFWFPVILAVNNIGSMLQFKADFLNHKCLIPDIEQVRKVLNAKEEQYYTTEDIVNSVFK